MSSNFYINFPAPLRAQIIALSQTVIARASICALTKVRALFWASAAASTAGLLLAIWALLPHGGHTNVSHESAVKAAVTTPAPAESAGATGK
ncbi:MAG: hypothetical protein NTX41_02975 [Verrucomicrobia bacterium]|nr:hypothetical protein [Verrucomicrobiota bacterium]